MINIVIGRSTVLTVTFISFDDNTDTGSPVDPDTVVVNIRNSDDVIIETHTGDPPVGRSSVGVYYFTWTPSVAGNYSVEFVGTYSDLSQDIILEEFDVSGVAAVSFLTNKLGEDQYLQFMPELSHMYVDPEDILLIFPDASPMDIAGLIHQFSLEVEQLMGPEDLDITKWSMVNFDYIKAATLCSLSKLYGFGDADLTQITLGDLSVTNQRFGRTNINRATAVTWCEIAAALRTIMIDNSGRHGFRAIVKGAAYDNPIPPRFLRGSERGLR